MPTYNYKCASCEKTQEAFQFLNEPPLKCEKCNIEMDKEIHGSPMIRKGGGLYSLDIQKPGIMGEE